MTSLLLSISSVLNYILYIIIALLILMFLVMVHELGHYTAGKILGFKIDEFSIGFGPKLFQKKKKNGELFTIRAVPLGGYCAFDGEDTDSASSTAFNNQKPWKRLIVLVSGVLFNFLIAVVFAFILLTCVGYEKVEVKKVETASINYNVLYEGDVIYGVNGTEFDFVKDDYFNSLISEYTDTSDFKADQYVSNGEKYSIVPMNIVRDGEKIVVDVRLKQYVDSDSEYWSFMAQKVGGTEFDLANYKTPFVKALGECWDFSFRWSYKILIILGKLITGGIPIKDLGGPVTTIKVMADTTSQNFSFALLLIPVIAINLAVFNILPIPSLDGARCVFVLIEWIRKKPINRDLEGKIHTIGLIALLGFVVLVDILHFIL